MMNKRIWFRQAFTYFWLFTNFLFLFLDKKGVFERANIDGTVLLVGNFILYAVTAFSFWLTNRSFSSTNPQAFVRAMYGSFMLKFFVVAVTAFAYIIVEKKDVNKPALLACAGLYIIYTALEIATLIKLLNRKKNA
jgi:hypothetical protein